MKRLIAAVSFAVLAAPVIAAEASAPFEQTQLDRVLPTLEQNASAGASSNANGSWSDDYNFVAPAQ
jgi:opacity protein-like surface antigen